MLHHRLRAANKTTKALTFVAAGTVKSGASPTVAIPSGVQAGDLLVLCVSSGGGTTTPSGWTLPTGANHGGGDARVTAFYKVAGTSESNFTLGNTQSRTQCGVIAYRPTGGTASYVTLAAKSGTSQVLSTNTVVVATLPALIISQFVKEGSSTQIGTVADTNQRLLGLASDSTYTLLRVVDEFPVTTGTSTARSTAASFKSGDWETNALLFGVT